MNWMKKVAVALVCLLPLGLQAAKVDTLQVKSPSMNKSIEVVVVSPDVAATEACPVIYLLHGYGGNARTCACCISEPTAFINASKFVFSMLCPLLFIL